MEAGKPASWSADKRESSKVMKRGDSTMCESNVYIEKDGKEELYLESVDIIKPEGGKIHIRNLFGEQKIFEGTIKEISLVKHKIVLK